jgi:hypothetical protein
LIFDRAFCDPEAVSFLDDRQGAGTIFSPEDGTPFSQLPYHCGKGAAVSGGNE